MMYLETFQYIVTLFINVTEKIHIGCSLNGKKYYKVWIYAFINKTHFALSFSQLQLSPTFMNIKLIYLTLFTLIKNTLLW